MEPTATVKPPAFLPPVSALPLALPAVAAAQCLLLWHFQLYGLPGVAGEMVCRVFEHGRWESLQMDVGRMHRWWACEWPGEKEGMSRGAGGQRRGGGLLDTLPSPHSQKTLEPTLI